MGAFRRLREDEAVSEHVATGPGYAVGLFRCSAGSDRWGRENLLSGGPILVIPRLAVEIRQAGRGTVIANANVGTCYNRDQEYERHLVHPDGDRALWFHLSGNAFHELQGTDGDPLRPFTQPRTRIAPQTVLQAEALASYLRQTDAPDHLRVHETLLAMAGQLLGSEGPPASGPTARRHREAARAMERFISARPTHNDLLADIAAAADLSEAHAARLFRRHTGLTLHAYRDQLRLRTAVHRLARAERGCLTELALDLGYASHSHFTTRFTRAFGVPPSQLAGRLAPL